MGNENYNSRLQTNNSELSEIKQTINNLPPAQKPEVMGKKIITENGQQTFTPPEGKTFSTFTADVQVANSNGGAELLWENPDPNAIVGNGYVIYIVPGNHRVFLVEFRSEDSYSGAIPIVSAILFDGPPINKSTVTEANNFNTGSHRIVSLHGDRTKVIFGEGTLTPLAVYGL